MKVVVSEIPRMGLSLDEARSGAEMDLEGQGISFLKLVHLHAEVRRQDASVEVSLAIDSALTYTCDRCLQKVEEPLARQLSIVRPAKGEKIIDITQIAREEIILEYPAKRLCRPDCKGLCMYCGRNLNHLSCSCSKGETDSPFRGVWIPDKKEKE